MDVPKIEDFKTRAEFNEWKDKTSSFTNKNNLNFQFKKNEFGVVATKKELNQIERDTKKAQRLADYRIKEVEKLPFAQGGTVGQRIAMFGRNNPSGITKPKDFKFNNVKTRRDLERRMEHMKEKSTPRYYKERNNRMKENFKEILSLSFHSGADELIDLIDQVHPDDFYEIYQMHFDVFDFALYDSEGQEVDADEGSINKMTSYIKEYLDGNMNMDLKGF